MSQFKERLWEQFRGRGDIRVLYYAPIYLDVFKDDPRWRVEEIKLELGAIAGNHHERHSHVAILTMKG